ncbi:MAG: DMT family transporter [Clostridia bacterium]|nr:DMT family transporter [Clostridia bacterium]
MFVSYSLISVAVVMFSLGLFFSEEYERLGNNNIRASFRFTGGSFLVGFIILFIINKFTIKFTLFSAIVSLLGAFNSILYFIFTLKALSKINLSLYSVFCSLGGMVLPFVAGLAFYHEKLTVGKALCLILIVAALAITVEKGNKSGGAVYYMGVFVFNGLSGVFAKFHNDAHFVKSDEASYSMMIALWCVLLCSILLIFNKDEKIKLTKKSVGCIAGYGTLNNIANLFLLLSLKKGLPASAQYPFVTGGIMIISTILCYFTPNKPKKKEIFSIILSFAGIMILCLFDK